MTKLTIKKDLPGEGRYIPELPWVEGSEETIEVKKSSPIGMAKALKHELRHRRYARRRDLIFRSVKERRAKEEIANALLDYLESRDREELRSALDFYQEQFELSDKVFSRYVLEVASNLSRWT